MITRRHFMHTLAAATAGLELFAASSSEALGAQAATIQLGAQTNAWAIDPMRFDTFLDVLARVRSIGYTGFETGFFNLSPQFQSPHQAHDAIAQTGLTFFGIHIAIPLDRNDPATRLPPASLYEGVARAGFSLGAQRLIFSGAPVPAATTAELKRKIDGLNTAGAYSKSVGLPFAYHNHWWEFQSKVGEIEALYAETDPALVTFLLDAGHAYRGGADVPAFLHKHHQRIVGLHLRDYHDGKQVPLGAGTFPLAAVAATLQRLHWNGWVLNEEEREDGTKLGESVMKPSFAALRKAFPQ